MPTLEDESATLFRNVVLC